MSYTHDWLPRREPPQRPGILARLLGAIVARLRGRR